MLRSESLRARLLSVLGTGALAAATATCSGHTDGTDTAPTAGTAGESSGGSSGKGGSGQGGSGQGGSGGTGQGGVIQGGNGGVAGTLTGGYGGIIYPTCPPAYEKCLTDEELTTCVVDPGAGSAGLDGGMACPISSAVAACVPPGLPPYNFAPTISGPLSPRDSCCYMVYPTCPAVGRPFTVDGDARAARARARTDWTAELGAVDRSLPKEIAERLASAWLDDALVEHASVASFARFTLELLALGAPPNLIADAQYAALDEIRHARMCFALSSRYSGKPVGPSALDVSGALGDFELASVAVRCIDEGCIGETLAAMIASEQAQRATDPVVRRVLEGIAEDEARHAELAWRAVRWAIEQGGADVREAVTRTFEKALLRANREAVCADDADDLLRAHGRLSRKEAAELSANALREIVAPCARALLGNPALAA